MKFDFGFDVTVRRPGKADRHGNRFGGTPHTIGKCARNQQKTDVIVGGEVRVATSEQLYCDDATANVLEGDELTLPDGTKWQVSGEPERAISPFVDWQPGCIIPIERAAGLPAAPATP